MYLTMKIGDTIIDHRFISLRNVYEEAYVQEAIKKMIDTNEEKIMAYEEPPVFTLEETNPVKQAPRRQAALFTYFVNLFGKGL